MTRLTLFTTRHVPIRVTQSNMLKRHVSPLHPSDTFSKLPTDPIEHNSTGTPLHTHLRRRDRSRQCRSVRCTARFSKRATTLHRPLGSLACVCARVRVRVCRYRTHAHSLPPYLLPSLIPFFPFFLSFSTSPPPPFLLALSRSLARSLRLSLSSAYRH